MAKLLLAFLSFVTLKAVCSVSQCPYIIPKPPYTATSSCYYDCCPDESDGCCDTPFYNTFGFMLAMGVVCPIVGMFLIVVITYYVCRKRLRAKGLYGSAVTQPQHPATTTGSKPYSGVSNNAYVSYPV